MNNQYAGMKDRVNKMIQFANHSKLRYPMLALALLLLAGVALTARFLTMEILSILGPVFDSFSLPV